MLLAEHQPGFSCQCQMLVYGFAGGDMRLSAAQETVLCTGYSILPLETSRLCLHDSCIAWTIQFTAVRILQRCNLAYMTGHQKVLPAEAQDCILRTTNADISPLCHHPVLPPSCPPAVCG
jgi:hypothetical protein